MSEIVYVLSNPAMPGLLKIGRTDKDDLSQRMKDLYATGVPLPFDCVYACVVNAKDNATVEKALHEKFAKHRVNPRREFFKVAASSVVRALKLYEEKDITADFRASFDSPLLDEEKDARRKVRRKLELKDPSVAKAKELHLTIRG